MGSKKVYFPSRRKKNKKGQNLTSGRRPTGLWGIQPTLSPWGSKLKAGGVPPSHLPAGISPQIPKQRCFKLIPILVVQLQRKECKPIATAVMTITQCIVLRRVHSSFQNASRRLPGLPSTEFGQFEELQKCRKIKQQSHNARKLKLKKMKRSH